jgi:hypothetical protein
MSAAERALNRLELMVEVARADKSCGDYYRGNCNAYEHARDIVKREIENERLDT